MSLDITSIDVLHVDDEPGLTDLAAQFLERSDECIDVITARTAREGFDRLRDLSIDCIISDYDMPGQNGIEFLNAVRAEFPDLPFILFTGKGSEEIASKAISAGVTDYLQKGYGPEQYEILANRIRNSVKRTVAQRERQRHLDALEPVQDGISVIGKDEHFVYVNQAYADIYGYDPTEMVGEHWTLVYSDADEQAMSEIVFPRIEKSEHWNGETTGVRADGSTFISEQTLTTTKDGEYVCAIRDVTERKERERRYDAVFDNTYTFSGILEPCGTVLEVNETALTYGGLSREEIVGRQFYETYWFRSNEDSRQSAREAVEEAQAGNRYRNEIRVRRSDTEAVVDLTVRPIFDGRSEVTSLVLEGLDITDRTAPP